MKRFAFKFDKILEYRRNRRDLCRQLLAQIIEEDRNLDKQQQMLQRERRDQVDEMRCFGQSDWMDVNRSAARRYYSGQLTGEIQLVEHNREILSRQKGLCRQALVEADREVKVLQKLAEQQLAEHRYDQERQIARDLADVWLSAHIGEYSR